MTEPDRTFSDDLDFDQRNYRLFGWGLALIVVGWIALGKGSITIAPLALVVGYCVLIPMALLVGLGEDDAADTDGSGD